MKYLLIVCVIMASLIAKGEGQPTQEGHADENISQGTSVILDAILEVKAELMQKIESIKAEMTSEIESLKCTVEALQRELNVEKQKVKEQCESDNNPGHAYQTTGDTDYTITTEPTTPTTQTTSYSPDWLRGGKETNDTFDNLFRNISSWRKKNIFSAQYFQGYRISIVNNAQIWCTGNTLREIYILALNGSVLKEISYRYNPRWKIRPSKVAQFSHNGLLLASYDGLYVINITGDIQYKVADGCFSDVSVERNMAIAFNKSNQHLVLLLHINRTWHVGGGFPVNLTMWGTVLLHKGRAFVCSKTNSFIREYHLVGLLVRASSLDAGLYAPYICGVDSNGALLICNQKSKSAGGIKVWSQSGHWDEYRLPRIRRPLDMLINTRGQIFVLWEKNTMEPKVISTFTTNVN